MGSDELVKGDEKDADLGDDTSEEGNDVTIDKVDSAAAGSNGEGNDDAIDKVDNAAGLGNRFVQQICVVTASECVDVTGALSFFVNKIDRLITISSMFAQTFCI